ncbi:MAG: hypothetical protein REI64_13765 [Pedobacter sp.]|uniref:hypothetical protein n=1 Tax=Pedobacter sp. TaxID=1411316 RepID=UPI002809E9CE|nr:hypothetical protein [Pedobacter sp.]MDQ8005864.1 hypothetical protein [Pedobacter sp.]
MGLFNKVFGTSNKIKVQFIDNFNGETIGVSEMTSDQLPETFSVQTTMHIRDNDWTIEEAIPENAIDFIKTKSLVLKMRKVEKMNPNDIWFTTPTISNEFPQLTEKTKETEFDIFIHEDDYRQNEFLDVRSLTLVREEFKAINDIWTNHSKKSEKYTLFKNCHVRKIIGLPNLNIKFNELKALLKFNSIGQVTINGEVLVNGFAFKTDNTTYFGTLLDETIIEFCIAEWNDNSRNEILEINKTFNLLLVDWYNCDLIEND